MNQDKQIKQWIKEAGKEKAHADFVDRVMAKIEPSSSTSISYQPVIAPWAMKLIVGGILMVFLMVILFSTGQDGTGTAGWMTAYHALTSGLLKSLPSLGGASSVQLPVSGISPWMGYAMVALASAFILLGRWHRQHMSW